MKKIIYIMLIAAVLLQAKTIRKYKTFELAGGDSLEANVLVYNGNALIKGYLNGDLTVYSGDINILDAGVVTGQAKSISGKVYRKGELDEESSIYAFENLKKLSQSGTNIYSWLNWSDNEKEEDNADVRDNSVYFMSSYKKKHQADANISEQDHFGFFRYRPLLWRENVSYTKADGFYIGADFGKIYNINKKTYFSLTAAGGYGFGWENFEYNIGAGLNFFNGDLSLNAIQYDGIASDDQWKINPLLNYLSAFMIHEDFFHYYDLQGYGLSLIGKKKFNIGEFSNFAIAKVGYNRDTYNNLKNQSEFSVFYNSHHFFKNVVLEREGDVNLANLELLVSSYHSSGTGFLARYRYEESLDKDYNNDFSFAKQTLDLDWKIKLGSFSFSNETRFEGSTYLDSISGNPTIPEFKYSRIGGTGTLPGYRFNEFSGNRMFLNRSMLGFLEGDLVDYKLIFDAGRAWEYKETNDTYKGFDVLRFDNIESSLGIGVVFKDNFMFSIHKRLDTDKDPYQVQILLNYDFSVNVNMN